MKPGDFFPLADPVSRSEGERLELPEVVVGFDQRDVRAVPTGERRPPTKGEWFLSGAVVEAYRAKADMTAPYRLARLVRVREVTTLVITKE